MFSPVTLPNFRAPAVFSEKLTAGRLFSSMVGLAPRRSVAGHRRDLADEIEHRAGVRLALRVGARRRSPCPPAACRCAAAAALPSSTRDRLRPASARAAPSMRMISFARATSVTPGICTRIWSPAVAVPRDGRLGDAQLVDAAVDRLQRLHDRLLAQVLLDVRLHPEVVGAAGARRCGRSWCRDCSSATRRNSASRSAGMPFDAERRRRGDGDRGHRARRPCAAPRGSARRSSVV